MKTTSLETTGALLLLAAALAGPSYAGPGPQYWMRSAKPAPASIAQLPAVACPGCRNTPVRMWRDRGPAGKSIATSTIVGTKHRCTLCDAATKPRGAKTPHHTEKCAAMRCCLVAAK